MLFQTKMPFFIISPEWGVSPKNGAPHASTPEELPRGATLNFNLLTLICRHQIGDTWGGTPA
jgi:hypothetical protein